MTSISDFKDLKLLEISQSGDVGSEFYKTTGVNQQLKNAGVELPQTTPPHP